MWRTSSWSRFLCAAQVQAEVGAEDASSMELHQADDARVSGGVEEEGSEGHRAGQHELIFQFKIYSRTI